MVSVLGLGLGCDLVLCVLIGGFFGLVLWAYDFSV